MAHALTLVRLDLRDLAAPEPMDRILDCLRTLQRGERSRLADHAAEVL